jgi:hypothetical protein
MKNNKLYLLGAILIAGIIYACHDTLTIMQDYAFDWQVMPYQTRIVQGETVEIRCKIIKEGNYKEALYYIRYFQPDGNGELRLDDGRTLSANDLLPLPKEEFRLYYTSHCTDQQTVDIYIEDTFGKVVQKSFGFQNKSEKEEPVNLKFTVETLPVPRTILQNDTIEIRCQIIKEDEKNTSSYSIRYFQTGGKGTLLYNGKVLKPNDLYSLETEIFVLNYVSNCTERQTFDIYFIDSIGQTVQKTFSFENQYVDPEPEIDYNFTFETLPVPKSVIEDETVEIRCQLKRADIRNDTDYSIRYFQPDGKGELRLENGTQLTPNDLFPLQNDVFRLYYTSRCVVLQTIDIYIVDTFGTVVNKTFSFANETTGNPDDNQDIIPDPDDESQDETNDGKDIETEIEPEAETTANND